LVWHYTSLNTLGLILEGKCFHATEATFHNDPNEENLANQAITNLITRKIDEHGEDSEWTQIQQDWLDIYSRPSLFWGEGRDDPRRVLLNSARFILCASTPDNFHMWRTYGAIDDASCAIGLRRDTPLQIVPSTEGHTVNISDSLQRADWTKVTYTSGDGIEELFANLEAIYNDPMIKSRLALESLRSNKAVGRLIRQRHDSWQNLKSTLFSTLKHPTYEHEKESRLTFKNSDASNICFKPSVGGPRPYIKVGVMKDGKMANLPIEEVMLGPTANPESKRNLEWLLTFNGYDNVEVSESVHKFRNV
jgi:hypothetical protein